VRDNRIPHMSKQRFLTGIYISTLLSTSFGPHLVHLLVMHQFFNPKKQRELCETEMTSDN
jgi:hypothetical protein